MLSRVIIKKQYPLDVLKQIINFIAKPKVKLDTIEKKYLASKIVYEAKFVLLHCRQPFVHRVDYLLDNIEKFDFTKHEIATLAYFKRMQLLENSGDDHARN